MVEAVEKLCPQLGYIIDIQNGWDKNLKLQTLEDWRLIKRIKLFFASKAPVNEVPFNSILVTYCILNLRSFYQNLAIGNIA